MPIWSVKAVWREDETEASEQWEVNADTAHEAVKEVSAYIRFPPHHVEASQIKEEARAVDLGPGQVRRRVPSH
jgi:hypothetical protein